MAVRGIRMEAADNVAVVTADVPPGEMVEADGAGVRSAEAIPRGGKVALTAIPAGGAVVRYGEEIGLATQDIRAGEHVHTHNLGASQ